MSEIYNQLIPNDDNGNANYDIVPKIGAFEVSINGIVSTFYNLNYLTANFF